MRIVHVITDMNKGGAERYCADVCAELATREGVEVMLLSMSKENNTYSFITDQLNYQTCDSKVLPSITGKGVIQTQEYDAIISTFQPDIIHTHLFWAELLTRYAPLQGVRYVTHCQNNMPEFRNLRWKDYLYKERLTQAYEKWWIIRKYRQCRNNFLVISKDTEAYYLASLPPDLHKITLLYHAINFHKFNSVNTDRTSTLNKISIVYTARFAIYKNHLFLVDIVEAIKNRGYDVELNFLGTGDLLEEVQKKVVDKGLEGNIKFCGVVDDVETHLGKANFYVHPAYYEPFGLVIIEAMAAGLPVVCLDGKGNRDLIQHGKNGFMFFDQDPVLFAEQIIELATHKNKYQEMVEAGIKYAKGFDIKQHVDTLLDYYHKLQ